MRKLPGIVLSLGLLVAAPALAGDLTLSNGQTSWHSTQCAKPNPPASFMKANPETSGDDMNSLMAQHNAYVDTAQAYMNCVANEASQDQSTVDQQIANAAQRTISDTQSEIDREAEVLRNRHR